MKCLIAVVGPTAVGKSTLGISIAQKFKGEIVNADSRQIYKYMDIGTAKPGRVERGTVPHHLLDIIEPDQSYSLSLYQKSAMEVIASVHKQDKLPVIVGGSGQYVWAVIEGWQIPRVEPDPDFRRLMYSKAQNSGTGQLYDELASLDPLSASKISPNNLRRIVRALEIYHKTGLKPSLLQAKNGLPFPVLIIGLTAERNRLYSLINQRTDNMIEQGFIQEVKELLSMGYSVDLPSLSSLGYRQMATYLNGGADLAEAVQTIKYETHRFVRGQYAWFRLNDSRIKWFDTADEVNEKINYTIDSFLKLQTHLAGYRVSDLKLGE